VIDADDPQGLGCALIVQSIGRKRPTAHGLAGAKLLLRALEITGSQATDERLDASAAAKGLRPERKSTTEPKS
jgi:hypothetical protein